MPSRSVVVIHDHVYGAVESKPATAPSTSNSTLLIPAGSLAVAATATVPDTVAPGDGLMNAADGESTAALVGTAPASAPKKHRHETINPATRGSRMLSSLG